MNLALGVALERSRQPRLVRYTPMGQIVDQVNRALGPLADRESEGDLNDDQATGSRFDMEINRLARAQGVEMLKRPLHNGIALNEKVFKDLCDESLQQPKIKGPLTPRALGLAYEDAVFKARDPLMPMLFEGDAAPRGDLTH
jgi:hypothetical protein